MTADWFKTVKVTPFVVTEDVMWVDGKPRCAHHPYICLVPANSIGSPFPLYAAEDHVCAKCLREAHDGE